MGIFKYIICKLIKHKKVVKCVVSNISGITKGETYLVIKEKSNYYVIENDYLHLVKLNKYYFI